ncbi:hypothetical protein KKE88_03610 [Patescibacteria group bacterium]|nr:hypothetical protein [Patescibacteria group bacterium]
MNLIQNYNTNVIQDLYLNISVLNYQDSIREIYERGVALEDLRQDIGNNLFLALSEEDKQFIIETEGSINFGYKASKDDLKRIFISIHNEYQY